VGLAPWCGSEQSQGSDYGHKCSPVAATLAITNFHIADRTRNWTNGRPPHTVEVYAVARIVCYGNAGICVDPVETIFSDREGGEFV
jgi:hypothetical protein